MSLQKSQSGPEIKLFQIVALKVVAVPTVRLSIRRG